MSEEYIKLNIGGKIFQTFKSTLKHMEFFETMFENDAQDDNLTENGEIFVNRNGILFGYVLDFLRIGNLDWMKDNQNLLSRLEFEAEFYGSVSLQNEIAKKKSWIEKRRFELWSLKEFETMGKAFADFELNGPIHSSFSEKYEVFSVIVYFSFKWVCPRDIYVHRSSSNCGRKCYKAHIPEIHGMQYVKETKILIAYK